jgi:hypothetical protein
LRLIALAVQPMRKWGLVQPPETEMLKAIVTKGCGEFPANPDGSAQAM